MSCSHTMSGSGPRGMGGENDALLKLRLALIVVDNSQPVGILTKIDVLDYAAGKI